MGTHASADLWPLQSVWNEMEVFPEAHEKRLRWEHSSADTGPTVLQSRPVFIYCCHANAHVAGVENETRTASQLQQLGRCAGRGSGTVRIVRTRKKKTL